MYKTYIMKVSLKEVKLYNRIMKNLYYAKHLRLLINLLLICVVFASCHSYKAIELSDTEIQLNKKYKITTTKYQNKKMVVKDFNDSEILVEIDKKDEKIARSEIKEMKSRKFSYIKTFVVTPVTYMVSGVGLVFFALAVR